MTHDTNRTLLCFVIAKCPLLNENMSKQIKPVEEHVDRVDRSRECMSKNLEQ